MTKSVIREKQICLLSIIFEVAGGLDQLCFPLTALSFFSLGGAAVLHNGLLGMPLTPALAGYSFAPRPAGKGDS